MRSLVILCIIPWLMSDAWAGGIVVWMEAETPDSRTILRVDNRTGGTSHLAFDELAFPPAPWTEEDDQNYESLRRAVNAGKQQWDEFEVEFGIATELEAQIGNIDIVRNDRDLQQIVDSRLFQGAAVHVAFEPEEFATSTRADPFRVPLTGTEVNRPWLIGHGLHPERDVMRSDVADGASFPTLQRTVNELAEFESARLRLGKLPKGAKLVVDGRERDVLPDLDTIELSPGEHYLHLLRNDEISGRMRLYVWPRELTDLPIKVTLKDTRNAKAQVLNKSTAGLSDAIKESLETISLAHGGAPIFIAASGDGNTVVLPYSHGAELLKRRPVRVVASGEIGAGTVISPLFDNADGGMVTAPAGQGGFGLEVAIYHFAVAGGFDLSITPDQTLTHGNPEQTRNFSTSILAQPWIGLGGYALKPTGHGPTFLGLATFGWNAPSHLSVGGRLVIGIPLDTGTWVRLTAGGNTFPSSLWDEGDEKTEMHVFFFRVGLAKLF